MGTSKNLLRGHLLHLLVSVQYLRRSLRYFEVPLNIAQMRIDFDL